MLTKNALQIKFRHYLNNFLDIKIIFLAMMPFTTLILLSSQDMWDGVLIQYAISTNDFQALNHWFFGLNYELQYYLIRLLVWFSIIFEISFYNLNKLLIVMTFFISAIQLRSVASKFFKLNSHYANLAACLFCVWPFWNVLISSALSFHLLMILLGLKSINLIYSNLFIKRTFGYILALISFQLNSLLFFLPIMCLIIDILDKNSISLRKFRHTLFLILISCSYFIINRFLNQPNKFYGDYNYFINPFFQTDLYDLILGILGYSTFLFPILVFGLIFYVLSFRSENIYSKKFVFDRQFYALMLVLYFAAVFPYLVVGRSTSLVSLGDWDGRQAFVLSIPLALLFARIINDQVEYFRIVNSSFSVSIVKVLSILVILFFVYFQCFAFLEKISRQDFERLLTKALTPVINEFESGPVHIDVNPLPGPYFRVYESNYLMFKSSGEIKWWTTINSNNSVSSTLMPKDVDLPNGLFIYDFASKKDCEYFIKLKILYLSKPTVPLLHNLFFYQSIEELRIVNLEKVCQHKLNGN